MLNKSYSVDGKVYDFTNVRTEGRFLYGRCTTHPYKDRWAWLDPYGFQIEGRRRIKAVEITRDSTLGIPHGCHYWGGEIRNNSTWRKQW